MSFDNVLANASGKADIAIAGFPVTDERKKVYDFLTATIRQKCSDCQKDKVNDYTSTDSLAKQMVGTQKGLSKKPLLRNKS